MNRAVFLDRDGVINSNILRENQETSPRKLSELYISPKVIKSLKKLNDAKFELIVVTNQPDIARGLMSFEDLDEINSTISKITGIRNFYICTHDNHHGCLCRKPKPGLITKAANELNLDIGKSFMVGDRESDLMAGVEAGCKMSYLISSTKSETSNYLLRTTLLRSLEEVVDHILLN